MRWHVTFAGLTYCALIVGILFAGLLQPRFAPQTELGQFVSSSLGPLVYLVGVVGFSVVIAMVLQMLGFTLFHPPNDEG